MSIDLAKQALSSGSIADFNAAITHLTPEQKGVVLLYVASYHHQNADFDAVPFLRSLTAQGTDINFKLTKEDAGQYKDLPIADRGLTALVYSCCWGGREAMTSLLEPVFTVKVNPL